jgi:hypothetical protein
MLKMYNQNILKAIDDINQTCQDPERHQRELEKLMNKYQAKTEEVKTLPNGIKLFRILDKDGLTIGEYHGLKPVKSWGGPREGAGRPATGAMPNRTIRMTDDEYQKVKEYLQQLRSS